MYYEIELTSRTSADDKLSRQNQFWSEIVDVAFVHRFFFLTNIVVGYAEKNIGTLVAILSAPNFTIFVLIFCLLSGIW